MSVRRARRLSWVGLAAVAVVSLAVGAVHPGPAMSPAQRAATIESQLRCPSCQDVSVAQSSAPSAQAIRRIVAQQVTAGRSDSAVEGYLVSRYGQGILLRPPASGGIGLVWLVPVVAVIGGLVGLGTSFWRRRKVAAVAVSDDDRLIVSRALADRGVGSPEEPAP